LEHRDDLSELLLNGLPHEEREHVIEVIKQGDEAKLRRLRDETPGQREAGEGLDDGVDDGTGDGMGDGMGDEESDDQEMAGAAD
jgi:hypothetical protein